MPIYDYVCTACGHRMEIVHGIHGHGPEACPVCRGAMRKAVVAPAVHFKGSGWAKKDRGAATATRAAAKAAAGGGDGAGPNSPTPAPAGAPGAGEGALLSTAAAKPAETPRTSAPSSGGTD